MPQQSEAKNTGAKKRKIDDAWVYLNFPRTEQFTHVYTIIFVVNQSLIFKTVSLMFYTNGAIF